MLSPKWYAIILSCVGEFEGTKAKLQNAPLMKEHFEVRFQLYVALYLTVILRGCAGYELICITNEAVFLKKLEMFNFVVMGFFQKAIELNPSDATSRHVLGVW